jgi:hypothetical protein
VADKQSIELGLRLYRLKASEDFAPLLAEWDARISSLKGQQAACASVYNSAPHIISNVAQRLSELESFRAWIDDEIERGGKEKVKQEASEEIAPGVVLGPLEVN